MKARTPATSPATGSVLSSRRLTPNIPLRQLIEDWRKVHEVGDAAGENGAGEVASGGSGAAGAMSGSAVDAFTVWSHTGGFS